MKKKYPIITLCGSTRFKDEFYQVQKELTLQGCIVISVGLFGHAGDDEVWEGMDENTATDTKNMLDDMHKSKIDLSDEIFIINPDGYIGESTWSEICYARMAKKRIKSMEPIPEAQIDEKVSQHIQKAELYAARQYDAWSHLQSDFASSDSLLRHMTVIKKGEAVTMDPWVPEDPAIPTTDIPYIGHAEKSSGYDPFKVYGVKEMARFIEDILMRHRDDEKAAAQASEDKAELVEKI